MADVRPRTALILGGASTLPADRARALELLEGIEYSLIACNHAARDEPGRVDHWVTMHAELLPMWMKERAKHRRPPAGQLWTARHRPSKVQSTPIESWGGSSGLLCVAVAFQLGFEKIILAGIPMQKLLRHYDDSRPWMEARQYWPAWERRMAQMRGRVKSLSGWTLEQLGEPTREWLDARST